MCLTRLEKFRPCTVGYKVFSRYKCGGAFGLYPEFMGSGVALPINIWVDEKDYRSKCYHAEGIYINGTEGSYPYGFHVFHKKEDAEFWLEGHNARLLLTKVVVKSAVATGYQQCGPFMSTKSRDLKVTVARYIKVQRYYE